MAERKELSVANLLLDTENPRLEDIGTSQEDTLRRLVRSQPEKILNLAEDIVTHGLSPADLTIVVPVDRGRYVVLEGNRRLAALRLLDRPDAVGDAFTKSQAARMRKLGSRFRQRRIDSFSAVIVADRDEAAHWIEMRHRGERGGAGIVSWGARESARFAERLGGARNPALFLLDLVEQSGEVGRPIREAVPKVPITNFQRLINDPDVRSAIGIERHGSDVMFLYPLAEVLKPLSRIVRQLAGEDILVSDIDTKELRKEYIAGFPSKDLPNPTKRLAAAQDLASLTSGAPAPSPSRRRAAASAPSTPRRSLVPRTTRYDITDARIAAIFRELGRLDIDDFPNAVAVLFRVFLELSIDHHVLENDLMTEHEWKLPAATLTRKIQLSADHLKRNKILTDNELQPVRRAIADRRLLATSIESFHAYVHNKSFSPIPGDLRVAWDDLDSFFAAIWQDQGTEGEE